MPGFKPIPAGVAQALRDAYIPFRGGLDQETSPWEVPLGYVRDAVNYEVSIEGGYEDIAGYERLDGRTSPSSAIYHILNVTITGSVVAGNTVTGATSGASAYVVSVVTDVGDDDYLVLTKLSGNFDSGGENIQVSAVTQATSDAAEVQEAASTTKLHAQYKNAAADVYRADIAAVPGEGSILGCWILNDVHYAFRNAVGGATAALHKSSASGWTAVALGRELSFTSGGTTEIEEGQTITGATSGATAVVTRVALESGSWSAGDAVGRFIFASQVGTFQAENIDVGASLNLATIAGDSSAITLSPSGSYEFANSNFMNPGGSERMYGVDGVNRGFEFDGTVFAPIATGMATDTPDHLIIHEQHLMFAFGSSHQISGINAAFTWTVLAGASEIITDGMITGYQTQPGQQGNGALLVSTRNRMYVLYGVSSADFNLVEYREEVGAYAGTLQTLARTLFLHDQGITDIAAVQAFGNFKHGTLSTKVQTLINSKRSLVTTSCIVRDKNQYRLFFSDKTAVYVTMAGTKVVGIMPVELEDEVLCMASMENSSGAEEIIFGSDDGFVYQLDKGTSFDGDSIVAALILHFTNDAIRRDKTYHDTVTIEGRGNGYAEVEYSYVLDYGDPDVFQASNATAELSFAVGGNWDEGGLWDTLFWDGQALIPTIGLDLRGEGENVSFTVRKDSDYMEPVRLTGLHYRYMLRNRKN